MISIIIPTFNRSKQLKTTLNSFNNLNYDNINFEIIIIDNGSTDDTLIVVNEFRFNNPNFKIIYKFDKTPGLLTGRHLGAKIASGDILSFIDDDVVLSKDWLISIDNLMRSKSSFDLFTGPCLPLYESYPPKWLKYFWRKSVYGGKICLWLSLIDLKKDEIEIDPNYVWGLNFTIRKSVFIELNGFNPDNIPRKFQMFQGDGESGLTKKAVESYKKALYNKNLLLYHQISKERLTHEYFDNRAYYAGVCNSFSTLRYKSKKQNNKPIISFFDKLKYRISNILFIIYLNLNPDIKSLYRRFSKKEQDGYNYHQEQYKLNLKVREWVHRKDFLNYKLPDLNS